MKKTISLIAIAAAGLVTLGGCSYLPHMSFLNSPTAGDITLAEPSTYGTTTPQLANADTPNHLANSFKATQAPHVKMPSPYAEFKKSPPPTPAQLQDDTEALHVEAQQVGIIDDVEHRANLCQTYSHNMRRIIWELTQAGTANGNPDIATIMEACPGMQMPD